MMISTSKRCSHHTLPFQNRGYPTNIGKFSKFRLVKSTYLHNLHPRTRSCFIEFIISNLLHIWPTNTVTSTRAATLGMVSIKPKNCHNMIKQMRRGIQTRTCNGPIVESSSLYPQLTSHRRVKEAMNEYQEDEEEVHSAHQLCTLG